MKKTVLDGKSWKPRFMEKGRADYASSAGRCLPHVQAALAQLEHSSVEQCTIVEFLLHGHVRRLVDLAEDLRSYALKREALRRGRLHQEEASA